MRGKQFEGMLFSEFEQEVLKTYPFANIDFDGGGMLVVKTGIYIDHISYDDKLHSPMHNGNSEIEVWTDLYLDDSKYEEEGEERIICEETMQRKKK